MSLSKPYLCQYAVLDDTLICTSVFFPPIALDKTLLAQSHLHLTQSKTSRTIPRLFSLSSERTTSIIHYESMKERW